ncbi:uncharacterized protein IL334_002637 [Kwoniella shivajii]|uniref:GATA-type domain-containing protein n=1 Tax=Kwoniella shivajii TaxID=564305 RepID=A0ABZ1CVB3_9TREE|nr:hypothetical protein IL334_002637 [Kwoniella shivajii]
MSRRISITRDIANIGYTSYQPVPASSESTSASSEATSSPYIPTPSSSSELPLPETSTSTSNSNRNRSEYQHQHQRTFSQSQRYQHQHQHQQQRISNGSEPRSGPRSGSGSGSGLGLGTFLSSYYYPESTNRIMNDNMSASSSGEPEEPMGRFGFGWDGIRSGGDLLEGVNLLSPSPRSSSSNLNNSGGGGYTNQGPDGHTSPSIMDLAGSSVPHIREPPTVQSAFTIHNPWNENTGGNGSGSGSNSAFSGGNSSSNSSGLRTWQPGPSSSSLSQSSQLSPSQQQQQQQQQQHQASHVHHQSSVSPSIINRQISASPHLSHLAPSNPNQSPYSNSKHSASASPVTSGSMLPPPNPNSNPMSMGRSWSEPTIPENTPHSAGYPGIMYGNVPLPEGYSTTPPFGGRSIDHVKIGPDEYSQAIEMYNYLLSAIPHISPSSQSSPPDQSSSANKQSFESLISLASDSYHLLTGLSPPPLPSLSISEPPTSASLQKGKRRNSNSTPKGTSGSAPEGGSKKVTTKCLGCGATETPEWRRGPMGPRTLCNACGLVHMKLQRKKKKAEEKARIAAAAVSEQVGVQQLRS